MCRASLSITVQNEVEVSGVPHITDPEASAAGINHAVLERKFGPERGQNRVDNSKLSFSSVGRPRGQWLRDGAAGNNAPRAVFGAIDFQHSERPQDRPADTESSFNLQASG